jgi:hypothetical protein
MRNLLESYKRKLAIWSFGYGWPAVSMFAILIEQIFATSD